MGTGSRWPYLLGARLRDLIIGTVALTLGLPVMILLGLVAGRSSGASAIFRQERVGRDGRNFMIYKLRTMYPTAPTDVRRAESAHLVTPIGSYLRRTKIDELPQLWNVVKGDMSLVGPRPIIPSEYGDRRHKLRLAVRPGLTGLWQLSRVRDEPFDQSPEYDLFYLANRSLAFDTWLIWRTILLLLIGQETKIRLAARMWERDGSWRRLVPTRERAIPARTGWLRSRLWLAAGAMVVIAIAGLGGSQALKAQANLLTARTHMTNARTALSALDAGAAAASLDSAEVSFAAAQGRLDSWMTLGLRAIPGLNGNIAVGRAVTQAGTDLVDAGREGLEVLERLPTSEGRISPPFKGGTLDGAALLAAGGPAVEVQQSVIKAQKLLASSPSQLLLPQVRQGRTQALQLLAEARDQVDSVAAATVLIPRIFGFDDPRSWLMGAENLAELRGRGGYLGSLGSFSADAGKIAFGDFKAVTDLPPLPTKPVDAELNDPEYLNQYEVLGVTASWQNLMFSPDFPTGARVFLANMEAAGQPKTDGLISLDPIALSYLMEATGPVEVPGIPELVTAANVVDWSLNRLYFLYGDLDSGENDQRRELLSAITTAVSNKLFSVDNLDGRKLAEAMGKAISGRHLVLFSTRPDEQKLIEQLGIGGRIDNTDDDYLLLVAQNNGENKMDYYMTRKIEYTGTIAEDGSLEAEALVTMRNKAPSGITFPFYVGGPRPRIKLKEGHSRSFVSLFVPARARLSQVVRDGTPTEDFESSLEQGKRRLATYVELAPGASQTIAFRYTIPRALKNGKYALLVQNQATVTPDELSVNIQLPRNGVGLNGDVSRKSLSWNGELKSSQEIGATLEAPTAKGLMERMNDILRRPIAGTGSKS